MTEKNAEKINNVFIFLLDDLVQPNHNNFITELASEYTKNWAPSFLSYPTAYGYYHMDKSLIPSSYSKIHLYNIGLLKTDEFITQASSFFGIDAKKFPSMWESIYTISPETKNFIASIFNALKTENSTVFLIAPEMNSLHQNHLFNQLGEDIIDLKQETGNFYNDGSIYISFSNTNNKHLYLPTDLINTGITSAEFNLDSYHLRLCNDKIETSMIFTGAAFLNVHNYDACLGNIFPNSTHKILEPDL